MRFFSIVIAVLFCNVPLAFAYQCTPVTWHNCTKESCASGTGDMTIYFSPDENSVSRCDKRGCTNLKVDVQPSGVMVKAASAYNGYLLVVNTMDLSFTEVATSLTTPFIKMGTCER